ncbi:hypothetical protein GCM10011610_70030 [Nocardia rhizosphaerihabitans]|uniref:Transmembrane protein n=2 Tax=Nocardia rhizosphaerihabitans TaxID=1691570 RepID=A0ABQ2L2V3_9NOCA|nr:hypothetical protein GCM10011610_70030 [Nocardia rhizosphaerihabitans]
MRPTFRIPPAADLRHIVPLSALLHRDNAAVRYPLTRFSRATEWLGRLAAVMSAVLLVLVLMTVRKGLDVQHSTATIVDNFRQANQYFDERADLGSPARARDELLALRTILAELDSATEADVEKLALLLPDLQILVTAGHSDVNIANQLHGVASALQSAAGSLPGIAADANASVASVNDRLLVALDLVDRLNAELQRTTDKLAPIPAQGNLIPAPAGGN